MRALLAVAALLVASGCVVDEPSTESPLGVTLSPSTLRYAFAGEPLLVVVNVTGAGRASIEVDAPGAAAGARPAEIDAPALAEVTIVPDVAQIGQVLDVRIDVVSPSARSGANLSFEVADPMTPPGEKAAEVREQFAAWLAQAHPELGIEPGQAWVGAFARPNILVVSYFVYYSEDWEMGVRWHVMIPPYDWGEAYLRPRHASETPTLQWKVDSLSADPPQEPRAVPTEGLWR